MLDAITAFGEQILSFVQSNPLLILALCFMVYKQWQAKQPWCASSPSPPRTLATPPSPRHPYCPDPRGRPDFGGKVTTIHSLEEWDALLSDAAAKGKVVVVDAYATWCPPCKAAAPVYARMSEEYDAASCAFAKFNVDDVRALQSRLEVSAMPTFKLFKNKAEVGVQRGWSESEVRKLLEANGAKKGGKSE